MRNHAVYENSSDTQGETTTMQFIVTEHMKALASNALGCQEKGGYALHAPSGEGCVRAVLGPTNIVSLIASRCVRGKCASTYLCKGGEGRDNVVDLSHKADVLRIGP